MSDAGDADRLFQQGDECSGKGARALASGAREEGRALFRKAIRAYESALAAAPEDDPLLSLNLQLCIGARRFGLGEREEALTAYEHVLSALAARPDLAASAEGRDVLLAARLNRAECRLAEGAAEEALAEVEAVLALDPEHPYGPVLRARCREAIEETP